MSRLAAGLLALVVLLIPRPSPALFHLAQIDEVMSGVGADPSIQYVEVRMLSPLQSFLTGARVVAFDCTGATATVLAQAGANVVNDGTGVRWIVGTGSFATASGIIPDFSIASAALDPTCGMVCFGGGPGGPSRVSPENPPTWSITDLANYVNCVAYGGYSGTTVPAITQTTALGAGDGTLSLSRVNGGTTFALACPSPTNNAGNTGTFGPCTPPTTTSTTVTTTTSTLPPPQPLSGKTLLLKDNTDPTKKGLVVLSKDVTIALPANGSADDPTIGGATLRVLTSDGCAGPCDNTYSLPAGNWALVGKPGQNKGYKYKDKLLAAGPAKVGTLKPAKMAKVVGKGAALGHELAADPSPVNVVLTLGAHKYCLTFGGTPKFTVDTKFQAKDAPVGSCPP